MSNEERLTNLEEFNGLMMKWARRADERMDTLSEAQENSERKIAALADAQIRTEDALARLSEAQRQTEVAMARLTDKMAELATQQAHTDQRLDALIDIVREGREGRPPQTG
jgi:hypothetical protein